MRDILFRGKSMEDEEWIVGHYTDENAYGCDFASIIPLKNSMDEHISWGVYPDTIGQYTGLTDKNNTKIFEGDIVRLTALANDHHQKGTVTVLTIRYWWGNTCACFNCQESGTPLFPLVVDHEIEVIGNIYDDNTNAKEND